MLYTYPNSVHVPHDKASHILGKLKEQCTNSAATVHDNAGALQEMCRNSAITIRKQSMQEQCRNTKGAM